MRRYNAMVRIAGSMNHQVPKQAITAAEVRVLMQIHGNDAVHNITALPNEKNELHEDVKIELEAKYRKTRVGPDNDRRPVLRAVFPEWPNITLPTTAKDARIPEALLVNGGRPMKPGADAEAAEKEAAEKEAAEKEAAAASKKAASKKAAAKRGSSSKDFLG